MLSLENCTFVTGLTGGIFWEIRGQAKHGGGVDWIVLKDKCVSFSLLLHTQPDVLHLSNLQVLVSDDSDEVVHLRPRVELQQYWSLFLTGEFGRPEIHLFLHQFITEGVWQPRLGGGAGPSPGAATSQFGHRPGRGRTDSLGSDCWAGVGGCHHGGDVLHRDLQAGERLRLVVFLQGSQLIFTERCGVESLSWPSINTGNLQSTSIFLFLSQTSNLCFSTLSRVSVAMPCPQMVMAGYSNLWMGWAWGREYVVLKAGWERIVATYCGGHCG